MARAAARLAWRYEPSLEYIDGIPYDRPGNVSTRPWRFRKNELFTVVAFLEYSKRLPPFPWWPNGQVPHYLPMRTRSRRHEPRYRTPLSHAATARRHRTLPPHAATARRHCALPPSVARMLGRTVRSRAVFSLRFVRAADTTVFLSYVPETRRSCYSGGWIYADADQSVYGAYCAHPARPGHTRRAPVCTDLNAGPTSEAPPFEDAPCQYFAGGSSEFAGMAASRCGPAALVSITGEQTAHRVSMTCRLRHQAMRVVVAVAYSRRLQLALATCGTLALVCVCAACLSMLSSCCRRCLPQASLQRSLATGKAFVDGLRRCTCSMRSMRHGKQYSDTRHYSGVSQAAWAEREEPY